MIFNAHVAGSNGQYAQLRWEIARFTGISTIPPKGYRNRTT
jgi:hypothetical protein